VVEGDQDHLDRKKPSLGQVMLLSCCFREPKLKKEKQVESCCSDEEYSQNPAKEVVGGRKEDRLEQKANNKANNSTNKHLPGQERHPASRETRRLLKQRSQESVRSGERRSIAGSIIGEDGGRRSVLGEDGGRRSVLGGDENTQSLLGGGEEGRRSRLSEESRRSLVGGGDAGGGRQSLDVGGGRQNVALDDGKQIVAPSPPIPELERSRGRGEERRMEVKQGQANTNHQRRLEVRQDSKVEKKSTYERKVEERASTYLHWEETPSLPSPPATPPAEGQNLSELFSRISAVPHYQARDRSTKQQQQHGPAPETPPSLSSSNTSVASMQEVEKPLVRGLRKSTAFHDASLLQAQLEEEKRREEAEKEKEEKRRREVEKEKEEVRRKAEQEKEAEMRQVLEVELAAMLERSEMQQRVEREGMEKSFAARLAAEKERQSKELEVAVMEAKNEANRTISELNRQVVTERGKLLAEQQSMGRQLEEEWRMKEERLQQSLVQVEEREQRWQEERAEVLAEVQRLKAEASRMVAILAMEAEEENLSEEKRLSLGQEVYSLQLVVEMRSSEVRNLRQQLALANQQLEEMESTKGQLEKANARLDDLQAQVNAKNMIERQLSIEKSQLEMTVDSSNKAVERMSQNVEELQWRIRNNFDLPIVHHQNRDEQPVSLPVCMPESPVMMRTRPSLPDIPRNNVLLDFVAKEMLPGKSKQELGGNNPGTQDGDTSDFDFSPLTPSDQRIAVGHHQNTEEALSNQGGGQQGQEELKKGDNEDSGEGDGDVCSLDEGLGGISDSDIADGSTKETTVVGELLLSSGENDCGDDVKAEPASEDQITEEAAAEQSFSSCGSEDGGDAPPLPQVEPPRNPVERKPSRIPKMIQNGSPSKNCETATTEAEKGSKEAEGRMEKGDLKDRAFSPERRPSRISFETML